MPESTVTMKSWVEKAQAALTQARNATRDRDTAAAANTLTDARRTELDTAHSTAMAEARRCKLEADRMKGEEDVEREILELRRFDETPRPLHPQGAAGAAVTGDPAAAGGEGGAAADPRELQLRNARTADGLVLPFVPSGNLTFDQVLEARNSALFQFTGADVETLRSMPDVSRELRSAWGKYMHAKRHEHPEAHVSTVESRSTFNQVESRALSPYTDTEGGYIMNREMRTELIRQERNLVQIRKYARVIRTNAASVAFPAFKSNISTVKMRANQQIPKENISKILGKVAFTPHEYAKIIQVPEQLVEDATFAIVSFLAEEIALQSSEDEEIMFLNGSGSSEALGMLTAPIFRVAGGYAGATVPTGQVVTPEDIKQMPFNLRSVWRKRATWMTNRFALAQVSKFRTNVGGPGTGEFLFQLGLTAGAPNTLVGYEVLESEFFPNAFATGAAAGTPAMLFADLNQYWIVDRLNLTLKRIDELYVEESQIGFRYRKRVDAAPVRTEAFCALVHA